MNIKQRKIKMEPRIKMNYNFTTYITYCKVSKSNTV